MESRLAYFLVELSKDARTENSHVCMTSRKGINGSGIPLHIGCQLFRQRRQDCSDSWRCSGFINYFLIQQSTTISSGVYADDYLP